MVIERCRLPDRTVLFSVPSALKFQMGRPPTASRTSSKTLLNGGRSTTPAVRPAYRTPAPYSAPCASLKSATAICSPARSWRGGEVQKNVAIGRLLFSSNVPACQVRVSGTVQSLHGSYPGHLVSRICITTRRRVLFASTPGRAGPVRPGPVPSKVQRSRLFHQHCSRRHRLVRISSRPLPVIPFPTGSQLTKTNADHRLTVVY